MANEIRPRGVVWEPLNGSLDMTPAVGGGCRFLPSSSVEQESVNKKKQNKKKKKEISNGQE